MAAQQHGAHHRRRRQRDHQRDHNRDRDRHGEFAKQPADQAAHQQDRDKDGDQRHAHRHHGKADLAGAEQRGIQPRHAGIQVAGDVFQHDDGVVDHESGRDRQRHQREDVEAIAQQIHHGECRHQRHRDRHDRHQRRARIAQEREHDEDHQRDGDQQRDFDVAQRGADRLGAVDGEIDVDGGRDRGLELRHQRLHAVDHLDDVGARTAGTRSS